MSPPRRSQAGLAVAETARGLSPDERAELARLRRETQILREERDVLRKAVDFFAQETAGGRR